MICFLTLRLSACDDTALIMIQASDAGHRPWALVAGIADKPVADRVPPDLAGSSAHFASHPPVNATA
ncbi:MAG: hypothetical protein QF582_17650 [Alphaproteobacteria bacterium]|nr:hypothetical protein [Alphaproteobacteria bacterium]